MNVEMNSRIAWLREAFFGPPSSLGGAVGGVTLVGLGPLQEGDGVSSALDNMYTFMSKTAITGYLDREAFLTLTGLAVLVAASGCAYALLVLFTQQQQATRATSSAPSSAHMV